MHCDGDGVAGGDGVGVRVDGAVGDGVAGAVGDGVDDAVPVSPALGGGVCECDGDGVALGGGVAVGVVVGDDDAVGVGENGTHAPAMHCSVAMVQQMHDGAQQHSAMPSSHDGTPSGHSSAVERRMHRANTATTVTINVIRVAMVGADNFG